MRKKIDEGQRPRRHTDQHNQMKSPGHSLPLDFDNMIKSIEPLNNQLDQLHQKLAAFADRILAMTKLTEEVQKVEIHHEEIILDYLKKPSSIKCCRRRELFKFLTRKNNLSALIFMQIIYDRAPLGLLTELVQVSFNILVGGCQPFNFDKMKPNQIDSFANHTSFQKAFEDPSLNFLRLQKGTQKSKGLIVGSQALLELIRIFSKCLLLVINTQFLEEIKEDQRSDENLSSEPRKKVKKDPD